MKMPVYKKAKQLKPFDIIVENDGGAAVVVKSISAQINNDNDEPTFVYCIDSFMLLDDIVLKTSCEVYLFEHEEVEYVGRVTGLTAEITADDFKDVIASEISVK